MRIEAQNLVITVSRGAGETARILDDVSLVIQPGEFVCLLGVTGSGKSTLLETLAGRKLPDAGSVLYDGRNLHVEFSQLKEGIAFVPQQNVLYEDLTVHRMLLYTAQLRLGPKLSELEIDRRVDEAIRTVDLGHRAETKISRLSGGQKRRVALATEILDNPKVLFLDEVTSGLDECTDWEMMHLFQKLSCTGITVVCVTHTTANIEEFCDRVVLMAAGGVLAYAGPSKQAAAYFGVQRLGQVYRALAAMPPFHWAAKLAALPSSSSTFPIPLLGADNRRAVAPPSKQDQHELGRQLTILIDRATMLLVADPRVILIAGVQSVLVAGLLSLVFGKLSSEDVRQLPLLFFLGISSLWFGCNNASREIVKETAIFQRERDVNLSVRAYLLSKMIVLGALGILQVALLYLLANRFATIPGDDALQFLIMCMATITGTALGLLLSSASRTTDQANTLVPIALIPQILLAGVVVSLPYYAEQLAEFCITGYWVYQGMEGALLYDLGSAALGACACLLHAMIMLAACFFALSRRDRRPSAAPQATTDLSPSNTPPLDTAAST